MTLKSDKFTLKPPAEKSYLSELYDTWGAIEEYEAKDLAQHPERADEIRAEYEADRQALWPEIKAQREQLQFEHKWQSRWHENPLATDMVGLLAEAKTDEDVYSFLKAIADRFATAATPGEAEEQDYTPADIDPNLPAPASMRRLNLAKQREIEAEMSAALAARKSEAATQTKPLGEIRPPPEDERRQEHIRYSRSRTAVEPIEWDEIKRRAEEKRDER